MKRGTRRHRLCRDAEDRKLILPRGERDRYLRDQQRLIRDQLYGPRCA